MRVDDHDSPPTAGSRVDDQIGGYSEDAGDQGGRSGDPIGDGRAAYPGDEHDFATEHMTPTFSDELAETPGMQREIEVPRGMSGMDG